jgi:hypothetical protein
MVWTLKVNERDEDSNEQVDDLDLWSRRPRCVGDLVQVNPVGIGEIEKVLLDFV